MIFGNGQTISLEEVVSTVKGKKLQRKLESRIDTNIESLFVRGRTEKMTQKGKRGKSKQINKKSKESQGENGPLKSGEIVLRERKRSTKG